MAEKALRRQSEAAPAGLTENPASMESLMDTMNSKQDTGIRITAGFKAGVLVVVVGMIAAIAETALVESREARTIHGATAPASEAQPYYFPSEFSIGDAKAEPHIEAF